MSYTIRKTRNKSGLKNWRPSGAVLARAGIIALSLSVFASIGYYSASHAEDLEEIIAEAISAEVHSILVEGVEYTPNNALLQALALQKGSSLVGFSTAAARERLESLSWVREAVVNRSLPSTIKVEIFEHKPVARFLENKEDGGQDVWIINTEGARIAIDTTGDFSDLPIIQGLNSEKEAAELVTLLKETGFYNKVVTAIYVGERRWNLGFAGDMWVQLPENDALNALAILEQLNQRQQVLEKKGAMVDLRLDDRIIFRMPPKNKIAQRVL